MAIETEPTDQPPNKLAGWWPKAGRIEKNIRQFTAILLWAYAFLNLAVLDVDAFLLKQLPQSVSWIIPYKFFVILALLATSLAFVSNKRIVAWGIYILFYPLSRVALLVLYIIVAVIAVRSWPVIFSIINICLSFFRSFKVNFVLSSALIICSAVTLISASVPILLVAAAVMACVALTLILRRFASLFRPSQLLVMYTKVVAVALTYGQVNFALDPALKALPHKEMSKDQLEKWASGLENAVTINEICNFLVKKFGDYRASGLPIVYYVLNFLFLLVAIIFLFTMITEALFKADAQAFILTNGHGFFDFLYYAFSSLFLQRIPDVTPVSVLARAAWMLETFFAFLLGVMFVSIFFAFKRKLDDRAIEQAIVTLQTQAATMEAFVQSEFSLSLDGAISELQDLKRGVTALINFLRANSTE